jgi:rRNA processing protein Gar1
MARGQGQPRLGTRVTDVRGREVGKIVDLIGPVREPYVIIMPARGADPRRMLGQELFIR